MRVKVTLRNRTTGQIDGERIVEHLASKREAQAFVQQELVMCDDFDHDIYEVTEVK